MIDIKLLTPLPDGNKYEVIRKYCKEYTGWCGDCALYEVVRKINRKRSCKCNTLDDVDFLYDALCKHYNMNSIDLYYFIMKKSKDDDSFVFKHGGWY